MSITTSSNQSLAWYTPRGSFFISLIALSAFTEISKGSTSFSCLLQPVVLFLHTDVRTSFTRCLVSRVYCDWHPTSSCCAVGTIFLYFASNGRSRYRTSVPVAMKYGFWQACWLYRFLRVLFYRLLENKFLWGFWTFIMSSFLRTHCIGTKSTLAISLSSISLLFCIYSRLPTSWLLGEFDAQYRMSSSIGISLISFRFCQNNMYAAWSLLPGKWMTSHYRALMAEKEVLKASACPSRFIRIKIVFSAGRSVCRVHCPLFNWGLSSKSFHNTRNNLYGLYSMCSCFSFKWDLCPTDPPVPWYWFCRKIQTTCLLHKSKYTFEEHCKS